MKQSHVSNVLLASNVSSHLSVDYLSARSLSDCHSSLYITICLNTAPQTKYLNTAPDTVAPRRCIQSDDQNGFCTFSFRVLSSRFRYFRSVFNRFHCVSVLADLSVSVFVNGFIIFPLMDISVSVNGNHTALGKQCLFALITLLLASNVSSL